MMRKLRNTLLIMTLSVSLAFSQTVHDFTVVDTYGETHELYADYLDQGKTVVIDFFFTNCPLCSSIGPHIEELYQDWGAGEHDVQFIGLTIVANDNDMDVVSFDNSAGINYPSVSADGGAIEAGLPFLDGDYGESEGTPAFAVISPDGTVRFDIFGSWHGYVVPELTEQIIDSGATHPSEITSLEDALPVFEELIVYPNPVRDFASVNFTLNENADVNIEVFNMLGQPAMDVFIGNKYPGYHQVDFNPSVLSPGTYFVRIAANNNIQTTRLVKLHSNP